MNTRTVEKYISPAMEVMTIEVEQAILNGSYDIEKLGERYEDLEW